MLITVLAPELLITKNWDDLIVAWRTHGKLRQFAEEDGVPWTMTHTLLASMGGFVIRTQQDKSTETRLKGNDAKPDDDDAIEPVVPRVFPHNPLPNPCHVVAMDIFTLRQSNHVMKLPHITEEEINDKSKSNSFVKAIAVTQIIWMVVQIIMRTSRGLAITQLEIAVMAFSVCAVILYILNWGKPKDIKTAFTLAIFPEDIPHAIERHLRAGYISSGSLSYPVSFDSAFDKEKRAGDPVRNDRIFEVDGIELHILAGLIFGCSIFGGIHIAAWTFNFPSRVELIFWRVAGIWCTVFALATVPFVMITDIVGSFFIFMKKLVRAVVANISCFICYL